MQAIVFMGIQASGKSTFYHQRFANTHLRINLDMLKTRHREKRLLEVCLETKQPFVVDNTNPTVDDRRRYIEPARNHQFQVIGYYFQSKLAEALHRNQQRENPQQIPNKGIRGTYSRLVLPQYTEGFDELYYVQITPENQFNIMVWSNEI